MENSPCRVSQRSSDAMTAMTLTRPLLLAIAVLFYRFLFPFSIEGEMYGYSPSSPS
jgi:hypothetical protein